MKRVASKHWANELSTKDVSEKNRCSTGRVRGARPPRFATSTYLHPTDTNFVETAAPSYQRSVSTTLMMSEQACQAAFNGR